MRNPARIPVILELLGRVWADSPDQRLAQLVCNVCSLSAQRAGRQPSVDNFSFEDPAFLEQLQIMAGVEVEPIEPYFVD